MNFPIQAPPVMRGQDRGHKAQSPYGANLAVAQSQTSPLSVICAACPFVPPPWNFVCSAVCPLIFH
jgi:hypothetical protein